MQCWLWQIDFKLLSLIQAGLAVSFNFLTSYRKCIVSNNITFLILTWCPKLNGRNIKFSKKS